VSAPSPPFDLTTLNAMDRDAFVAVLGPAFENAPWVAAEAWSERPFASVAALHAAMLDVVRRAPEQRRLAFFCGHPELAGREAESGTMTAESTGEQSSAGLNALTGAERDEMQALNRAYRERHGFPFIIAVRANTKQQIFETMRARTSQATEIERGVALEQIGLITRGRIDALVNG
jgi:2-oxo-4-hydroxy-4-carboxy-5-ureidoimidazoline decarboxylase